MVRVLCLVKAEVLCQCSSSLWSFGHKAVKMPILWSQQLHEKCVKTNCENADAVQSTLAAWSLIFLVLKLISKDENVRVLHSFLALSPLLHCLFHPALLPLKNISTVFPRISAGCLFNGFWINEERLLEGQRLIEGGS